jgi:hypothetical protein
MKMTHVDSGQQRPKDRLRVAEHPVAAERLVEDRVPVHARPAGMRYPFELNR